MCIANLGSFKPTDFWWHQVATNAAPNRTCTAPKGYQLGGGEWTGKGWEFLCLGVFLRVVQSEAPISSQSQWDNVTWNRAKLFESLVGGEKTRKTSGNIFHPSSNVWHWQQTLAFTHGSPVEREFKLKKTLNSEATRYHWSAKKLTPCCRTLNCHGSQIVPPKGIQILVSTVFGCK